MKKKQHVTFVGAGSMAEAIISGMLQKELYTPEQISVINRSNQARLQYYKDTYHIPVANDKNKAIEQADVLVLAMKPKDVVEGVNSIKDKIHSDQLVISVLAGVTLQSLQDLIEKEVAVVRVMPNTSASIGKSASGLALGQFATRQHKEITQELFETVGIVKVVEEEDLHAVTGLSGSGPAYLYYLVEAMEEVAEELQLDKQIAKELIIQTMIGAAEMLKTSGKDAAQLRKEVTSPGGTTEAGLAVLKNANFQEAIISCIKRAAERSAELGDSLT